LDEAIARGIDHTKEVIVDLIKSGRLNDAELSAVLTLCLKAGLVGITVHGTNPKGAWAGNVRKKFCLKHFEEYDKTGWLAKDDEIEIVPESECESTDHNQVSDNAN